MVGGYIYLPEWVKETAITSPGVYQLTESQGEEILECAKTGKIPVLSTNVIDTKILLTGMTSYYGFGAIITFIVPDISNSVFMIVTFSARPDSNTVSVIAVPF